VATVAVGWGGYVKDILDSVFGVALPNSIAQPPGEGGVVNLPAVVLVVAVMTLLLLGVRQSARTNTAMVIFKILVLAFFVVVGITAFTGDHFTPFAPSGFSGISNAAALIFFAYIGFDAVSTAGAEAREPKRDLPIAVIGSLLIATVIYILVAITAVGLAPVDRARRVRGAAHRRIALRRRPRRLGGRPALARRARRDQLGRADLLLRPDESHAPRGIQPRALMAMAGLRPPLTTRCRATGWCRRGSRG
jgi:amino acid transporter